PRWPISVLHLWRLAARLSIAVALWPRGAPPSVEQAHGRGRRAVRDRCSVPRPHGPVRPTARATTELARPRWTLVVPRARPPPPLPRWAAEPLRTGPRNSIRPCRAGSRG